MQRKPLLLKASTRESSPGGSPRVFKAILGLAAFQLSLALLCTICLIPLLIYADLKSHGANYIGPVFPTILFIITGSIGIVAAKRKNSCLVIAYMVLCIISTVLGFCLFIWDSVLIVAEHRPNFDSHTGTWNCTAWELRNWDSETFHCQWHRQEPQFQLVMAILGISVAYGVIEMVVAIVASGFTCKATCSRPSDQSFQLVGYQLIPTADYTPHDAVDGAPELEHVTPFTDAEPSENADKRRDGSDMYI